LEVNNVDVLKSDESCRECVLFERLVSKAEYYSGKNTEHTRELRKLKLKHLRVHG